MAMQSPRAIGENLTSRSGAAVTFDWSPDDATIAIPLTDENGVVSLSSNDSREVRLPG